MIEDGSMVDVRVVNGKIVAEPVGPKYALADLLRGLKKSNLHREVETGTPIGGEVW